MYRSGFSVLLLTIIVCAVGVALALSALSSSTQVARTSINVADAAQDESQARNCTEKVLAKLRLYKFYGGDETFSTEKCRVYTITGTGNGTRLIQVKRGNKILETKITQINPKIIVEYQKFVTSTSLDSSNPYVIDPLTLKLWLKADRAESNNGQPVINIKNATDDIFAFSQVSTLPITLAPILVTNAINNRPGLRFDGIDDFLTSTTTSIGNTTGLTVIVVGKSNSALTNQTYISKFNALTNKREWRLQNDNFIATDLATAEQANETVSLANNTNLRIIAARWAPTNASSININNTATVNATASFTDITSTDTPIIVGAQQSGASGFFKGDIAEIIVFSKKLSDSELITINSYLNNKYGVY